MTTAYDQQVTPKWSRTTLMRGGIYAISHDGRMYIGSSRRFSERWRLHIKQLQNGVHHSRFLQRAFQKHGESAFSFDVVEFVEDKSKLIEREQVWMDFFKPAFNVQPLARSSLGVKRSEDYKTACAKRVAGTKRPEDVKARISATLKGVPKSAATRAKMSAARIGWKYTEETKKRIGAGTRRRLRLSNGRLI